MMIALMDSGASSCNHNLKRMKEQITSVHCLAQFHPTQKHPKVIPSVKAAGTRAAVISNLNELSFEETPPISTSALSLQHSATVTTTYYNHSLLRLTIPLVGKLRLLANMSPGMRLHGQVQRHSASVWVMLAQLAAVTSKAFKSTGCRP